MSVINDYGQLLSPRYFIEADGTLAEDMIPFITKFEYEDDEAKSDKLTLTIANPGLRFKDDKRFKDGVIFRVRFGYTTDMSDMKNAIIAHARPHFGTGMPTIDMVAFGLQKAMNTKGTPVNYGSVSSSDVARVIAKRYGFEIDIEESNDGRRQSRVQAAGSTDTQFMVGLAKTLNWDYFIDGKVLHFHKKRYDEAVTLKYVYFTDGKGTLIKFEPDVNMTHPPAGAVGTDPKHAETDAHGAEARRDVNNTDGTVGKPASVKTGPPAGYHYWGVDINGKPVVDPKRKPDVSGKPRTGFDGSGNYVVEDTPETDPKLIAALGAANAKKVDMNAVKATAEMIGTPRLKARTMIEISGVDQQYSGKWRVTKAKHTIDTSGYKCSVDLKRGDPAKKDEKKKDEKTADGNAAKRAYSNTDGAYMAPDLPPAGPPRARSFDIHGNPVL